MDLPLVITLCFAFGVGVGIVILDIISSKREEKLKLKNEELIFEVEKLNTDIKFLKERLSFYRLNFAADIREFKLIETPDSVDIVLSLARASTPHRAENVLIKRFYFKNNSKYAESCAKELLNKLNHKN